MDTNEYLKDAEELAEKLRAALDVAAQHSCTDDDSTRRGRIQWLAERAESLAAEISCEIG